MDTLNNPANRIGKIMLKIISTITLVSLIFFAPIAYASDEVEKAESREFAEIVANIIVAEKTCKLTYKMENLERLIEYGIPSSNLYFATDLAYFVYSKNVSIKGYSETHKVVFCAQMKRVAKDFRLTE